MQVIRRVLKWTLLALLAAVLFVVTINAFDEDLRPEVQAALQPAQDPQPQQSNLLYAVMGFDAASDDIVAAGLARRRELDRQAAADPAGDLDIPRGPDALAFVGDESLVKYPGDRFAPVLATAKQRPAETEAVLAANARLMARYRSLRAYPHFVNSVAPGMRMPFLKWQYPASAHRVWRLWLADRVQRGRLDEAVLELRDDTLAWRRMLAQPRIYLIDKMLLLRWVLDDFEAAAALLQTGSLSAAQRAVLAEAAVPLTAAERSLAGVLAGEFRFMASVLRDAQARDALFGIGEAERRRDALQRFVQLGGGHLYKINATLNRQHEVIQRAEVLDAHDCSRYRADAATLQASSSHPDWWTLGYNPVGKILAGAADNGIYHSYSGRLCDLMGFQRLLALQLHLRDQGITARHTQQQIEAAITQAGAAYADPFTGGPMSWSPGQRGMAFGAADARNRKMLPWPL